MHVLLADLDADGRLAPALQQILTPDERQRGERYFFEHDRRRFPVGRMLLRLLLGHYADVAPQSIRFRYNAYGKPALDHPSVDLRFNLSNSANLGLFAFCRSAEIGVDIEKIRPEFAAAEIAEKYFSRDEVIAVSDSPDSITAFYDCWTRKEAYIKAKGQGLSIALDSFAVSLTDPPRLLYSKPFPQDVGTFAFYAPDVGSECRAAVTLSRLENVVSFFCADQALVEALIHSVGALR